MAIESSNQRGKMFDDWSCGAENSHTCPFAFSISGAFASTNLSSPRLSHWVGPWAWKWVDGRHLPNLRIRETSPKNDGTRPSFFCICSLLAARTYVNVLVKFIVVGVIKDSQCVINFLYIPPVIGSSGSPSRNSVLSPLGRTQVGLSHTCHTRPRTGQSRWGPESSV